MTPDEALAILLEGNKRFRSGDSQRRTYSPSDLQRLAEGQTPIAAVVACSDSRVSPNVVFDLGLGSIFACRVPGNVAAESSLWVADMAVREFQVPLVVVMAHTGCLAVTRVIEGSASQMGPALRSEIQRAVTSVQDETGQSELERAICLNATYAAQKISDNTPILRQAESEGKTRVITMLYDMASGEVRLLA